MPSRRLASAAPVWVALALLAGCGRNGLMTSDGGAGDGVPDQKGGDGAGGNRDGAPDGGGGGADGGGTTVLLGIDVTPAAATFALSTTLDLKATGRFSDGTTADLTALATWQSSNAAIVALTGATARALAPGKAVITASAMGRSGTASLTVTAATLRSISVEPINAVLPVSMKLQLKATGLFSDGSKQDLTGQASWTSSNSGVASVASGGVATGLKPGTTSVSASLLGVTGQTGLTVSSATLSSIQVTPADPTLPVKVAQQLKATGLYSDGSTLDVTWSATWASSDPTVLVVSNAPGSQGLADTLSAGTALVTASVGMVAGDTLVTVTRASLRSIAVAPATATVTVAATQAFTATGTYSDNTTADLTSSVAWSAADGSVAAVSNAAGSAGLATGLAPGSTDVVAALSGASGMGRLTVTQATVVGLAISPKSATVPAGRTISFSATATYSDMTRRDVTSQAAWSVADPSIAGISNGAGGAGRLTGIAPGVTGITATLSGASDTALVTVTSAALESISIAPATASLQAGGTQAFTAAGLYSDGSTLDITTQATWSVDDPMVAVISNAGGSQGLATAIGAGTSALHASLDGKQGTATLTVMEAGLVSISVTPIEPTRHTGESLQFGASGIYGDGTSRNVTRSAAWSSSDPSVASISLGRATCNKAGTATITATYLGKAGSTVLTCTDPTITDLQVTPFIASIQVGGFQPFQATAIFSDASTRDVTNTATWSSSDTMVANMMSLGPRRGIAAGLAPGMAAIQARAMGLTATATLTVTDAALVSLQVTPVTASLRVGQTQQFQAVGIYSDGSNRNLTFLATWQSSDTAVVEISNAGGGPGGGPGGGGAPRGQATGIGPGTATITATAMGLSAEAAVTVTAAKLVALSVTPVDETMVVGQVQQYQAVALYDDGSSQNVTTASTWSSSDPTVADASNGFGSRGRVTALSAGTVTVTATAMGVSGSTMLTVSAAKLVELQVTPVDASLPRGSSQQYQAVGIFSDGTSRNVTNQVTWTSSDPSVAVASNAIGSKGEVTAVSPGAVTIAALLGGVMGATSLTVTDVTVTEIQVTPTDPSVPAGAPQQFVATAIYSDFSRATVTTAATWTSSNESVAQVSNAIGSKGRATAIAAGTTTIAAAYMGVSGATVMTVTSATIKQIQVTPVNPSVPAGIGVKFTATAILTDNSSMDVTGAVTWTSSDESVATVSNAVGSRGSATTLKAGVAVIQATLAGVSGTSTLTVGSQTLVRITVTAASSMLASGQTQAYTATGAYSDMSTLDITEYATWISTDTFVAAVSNVEGSRGVVTAVSPGMTGIEAHFQGQTGSAGLTVTP